MDDEATYSMTATEFTGAVALAAQQVAQVHRRRLVLWGFIAGFLSTALIALPTEFVAAKLNCNSITQLARAQEQGFTEGIASRALFLKQSADRLGLTPQQFQELLHRGDVSQQRQLEAIRDVRRTDCVFR